MALVNKLYDQTLRLDHFEPKHLFFLLDQVTRRLRHDIAATEGAAELRAAHEPLTPSYYRVLWSIPGSGARVTDLASVASVTKQAMGQFVDVLVAHGYATQEPSAADRRVRIVRRTARGDALVEELFALISTVEEHWRDVLGAARYETFRELMVELSLGWED